MLLWESIDTGQIPSHSSRMVLVRHVLHSTIDCIVTPKSCRITFTESEVFAIVENGDRSLIKRSSRMIRNSHGSSCRPLTNDADNSVIRWIIDGTDARTTTIEARECWSLDLEWIAVNIDRSSHREQRRPLAVSWPAMIWEWRLDGFCVKANGKGFRWQKGLRMSIGNEMLKNHTDTGTQIFIYCTSEANLHEHDDRCTRRELLVSFRSREPRQTTVGIQHIFLQCGDLWLAYEVLTITAHLVSEKPLRERSSVSQTLDDSVEVTRVSNRIAAASVAQAKTVFSECHPLHLCVRNRERSSPVV